MKILDTQEMEDGSSVEIVPASSEDAAAIVNIQAETWLATYPNEEYGITLEDIKGKNFDDPKRIDRWKRTIESEDGHRVWVAKMTTQIVGFCLVKRGEKEQYIDAVYVTLVEQGKGIGRKLMLEALSWLGDSKPIGVGIAVYNNRAIAFYKKLGFKETTEAPESIPPLPSGKVIPIIKLVRPAT